MRKIKLKRAFNMSKKRRKALMFLSKYSPDGKAAVYTLGFTYLFLIAEIVYRIKIQKEMCTFELLLLFLIFAIFGLFKKLFTDASAPRRFDGTLLPIGDSKKEKKERNRYYRFSAFLYSLVFALVAFLGVLLSSNMINVNLAVELLVDKEMPNFTISLLVAAVAFVIAYIFTYMVDFLWYEHIIGYARLELEEQMLEAPDIKEDFEKIKAEQSEFEENIEEITESNTEAEEIKPAPKKRGRPRKVTVEESKN